MDTSTDDKVKRLIDKQRAGQATQDERKIVKFGKLEEGEVAEVFKASDQAMPVTVAVAPQGPVGAIRGPQRDMDAIETLTVALRQAESGHCRGVIVLMGLPTTDDHELVTDIQCDMSFSAAESAQIFAGGLRTAEWDLFRLHDDISEADDED